MSVSIPFSGMITHDGTITFTHTNGRVYNVLRSNPSYAQVQDKLRECAADPENEGLRLELYDLSQPKTIIHTSTGGRVRVENSVVLYDGKPVKNFLAERIIWMITSGFDAAPMLAFLEKVKENPSNRAVDELYRFMEANKMGLTKDGMILAYKRVSKDYLDIYTGTISNKIGDRPSMPRNEVNDDPTETCSHGLHVCAMSYLPSYRGAPGNHVMICAIHPKDVVSVPIEYHNAKMRVSAYEVIGEIEDQLDDILGRTPVWDEDDSEDEWQDWDRDLDDADDETDEDEHQQDDEANPVENIMNALSSIRYDLKRAIGPEWGRELRDDFDERVDEVRNKVIDTITYELGCMGGFSMDETLETLDADELDVAKVIIALEKKFELNMGAIGDDEITRDTAVSQIVDLIVALVNP